MSTTYSRISSANTFDNSVRNIAMRQSSLANLQENLTSGKRVVRTSDDPTSAAIAERSLTRISRIAADQRALESQRNAIAMAESTLGDMTGALQNFRELVVSAGNASHTKAERQAISFQLSGIRDQIMEMSNLKDTNGVPLFSALGSALKPFVGPQAVAPDYTFDGLPGQSASGSVSIPFALDGDSAFMFNDKRDAVYNAAMSLSPPNPIGVPPYGYNLIAPDQLVDEYKTTNRHFSTSEIQTYDPALVTGDKYQITFSNVGSGATPNTSTATYTITNLTTGVSDAPVTVPDFPSKGPVNIEINTNSTALNTPSMPGLKFTMSGLPATGDTITLDSQASIFSVLDDAVKGIGDAPNNNAVTQAVTQALHNIDIGMQRISGVRGQAGDLLTRAERITDNQGKRSDQLEADRSRAEDLDMIKGVSDFNNQQTGYQAALQTYAQIQKLSLFNFIG